MAAAWFHAWVPHAAARCPAFRSCAAAIGAEISPAPGHHSIHAFAMAWACRPTDKEYPR